MKRKNLCQKSSMISLIIIWALLSGGGCLPYYGSEEAKNVLAQYWPPASLKELTENPEESIFIIDVRPTAAYESGHISTALSCPSDQIESIIKDEPEKLPLDKFHIIHCETGGRAQLVIKNYLKPAGYTRFMNWGGIYRWKNAGYKEDLVTGPNPTN